MVLMGKERATRSVAELPPDAQSKAKQQTRSTQTAIQITPRTQHRGSKQNTSCVLCLICHTAYLFFSTRPRKKKRVPWNYPRQEMQKLCRRGRETDVEGCCKGLRWQ